METLKLSVDDDGIALVFLDVPDRTANTITAGMVRDLAEAVERLQADPAVKGVVLASAKASGFCLGADLDELATLVPDDGASPDGLRNSYEAAFALNRVLRRLETCGKPVAVALEGTALGGGLEIALAAGRRVARDDAAIQFGLPESTLGLMPGAGGTQRLPRLIGAAAALKLMLEGRSMTPREALAAGLVDALVDKDAVEAAKAWVRSAPEAGAAWDRPDYRIPGGGPYSTAGGPTFMMAAAMLHDRSYGLYPAQLNILKAVYEGAQLPLDAALRVETRYFVATLRTPEAKAMVRTLFRSPRELKKGAARPKGPPPFEIGKAGVLGAGMMGAGIAHAQAVAGMVTALIDSSQEAADRGLAHVRELLDKAVARGRMSQDEAQAALGRISASTDYNALDGCDIVIEAVFEDRALKTEVIGRAEARLSEGAVFASNTSTLPITELARASSRPDNFIGVHFFSPVNRMALVEIIVGEATSQATLAGALDYVRRLGKTPIVVRDSRGFYTSRCFSTYVSEGIELLSEGVAPAIIENLGRATGMPRGPLEMNDDVALDLSHRILQQARLDLGDTYQAGAADGVIARMVVDHDRQGRKNGKGFYDYPADGGAKRLWPGLAEMAPVRFAEPTPALAEEVRNRLLYRQALEAARCVQEGVITDPRDADVGAVMGWGFAPWTGGPLSLIDRLGVGAFVAACNRLAEAHGQRFAPPAILADMAARGERFYKAD